MIKIIKKRGRSRPPGIKIRIKISIIPPRIDPKFFSWVKKSRWAKPRLVTPPKTPFLTPSKFGYISKCFVVVKTVISPGFPLSGPFQPMTVSRARCLADFSTERPDLSSPPPTVSPFWPKVGTNHDFSHFMTFAPALCHPSKKKTNFYFPGFFGRRDHRAGTAASDFSTERPDLIPSPPTASPFRPKVGTNPDFSHFMTFAPPLCHPSKKKGDFAGFSTFRAFSADDTITVEVPGRFQYRTPRSQLASSHGKSVSAESWHET